MLRFITGAGFKVLKPKARMRKIHFISRKKHRWGLLARKNVDLACFLSGPHIHVCVGVLKRTKFLLLSLVQSNFMCCPCSLLKRFIMASNLPRRSRRRKTYLRRKTVWAPASYVKTSSESNSCRTFKKQTAVECCYTAIV